MKRLLLCLILAASGYSSGAQVLISILLGDKLNSGKIEFGLDGGANYSDIRGLSGGEVKPLFNIGFYFDIKTKNPQWLFHTGVIVKSSMGSDRLPVYPLGNPNLDNAFASGEVERKINYFNVPVMMKRKLGGHFYAEAGVMPALRTKAFDYFTAEDQSGDLEYRTDIKDNYHRLDFGLIGGVGYRLMGGNGMNLGIRYYYGLVDITIDDSTPDQFNNSLYLVVGIPIGAGKAKEEEAE
jgi:hypothetical protein